MAEARLNPHVAKAFGRHTQGHALPRITSLATRWSVWAQPSAEVPARVRRASPDDSHRLARQVVEALYDGEPTDAARIEQDFLDHCISCQDKLAFMLATRDLRRAEKMCIRDRCYATPHHEAKAAAKPRPPTRSRASATAVRRSP